MEYPAAVYQTPGPHSCNGGTFDSAGVTDLDDHIAALANGWFFTLDEAIKKAPQGDRISALRAERQVSRDAQAAAAKAELDRLEAEAAADAAAAKAAEEAEKKAETERLAAAEALAKAEQDRRDTEELARMEADEKAKAKGKTSK